MNHASQNHCGQFEYNSEKKEFFVTCYRDVSKNEEFTICYGDKNNADLLVYYGFIEENNLYDCIRISIPGELRTCVNFGEKQTLLQQNGIRKRSWWIEKGDLPIDYIVALRVYFMNEKRISNTFWDLKRKKQMDSSLIQITASIHQFSQILLEFKIFSDGSKEEIDLEPYSESNEQLVQDTILKTVDDLLNAYLWSLDVISRSCLFIH